MSGSPVPVGVDPAIPNGARIYDHMLGGKDNYEADRRAAEAMVAANPAAPLTARANRDFLGRAVRFLAAEQGIRQFLDIGAGLPTQQNVHEVALAVAPDRRGSGRSSMTYGSRRPSWTTRRPGN